MIDPLVQAAIDRLVNDDLNDTPREELERRALAMQATHVEEHFEERTDAWLSDLRQTLEIFA